MKREKVHIIDVTKDPEIPEPKEKSQNHKERYTSGRHYNRGYMGAFILIVLGILFLLNNFGLVPWSIWRDLWKFWPLFLIFWGLQMIFGRSRIANILLLIISIAVVGYFLLTTIAQSNSNFDDYLRQNFPIWNNIPQPPSAPQPPEPLKPRTPIDFGDDEYELQ